MADQITKTERDSIVNQIATDLYAAETLQAQINQDVDRALNATNAPPLSLRYLDQQRRAERAQHCRTRAVEAVTGIRACLRFAGDRRLRRAERIRTYGDRAHNVLTMTMTALTDEAAKMADANVADDQLVG